MGFILEGFGFGICIGFRLRVWDLVFRVLSRRGCFLVCVLFRVWSLGFKVLGFWGGSFSVLVL